MQTAEDNGGRSDGYLPIGSYALLGDGRTVALVGADGAVDWFPVPALNAPPAFAAVLDAANGGQVELAPAVPYSVRRRYRPGSPVLETTFATGSGTVTVADSLNQRGGHPLPWTELARVVRAEGGSVAMRWRVRPGRLFGSAEPWTRTHGATVLIELGDETFAVLTENAGQPQVAPHEVSGEFTAVPGITSMLALVATDREPLMLPPASEVIARVDDTAEQWRAWERGISYEGPHADAVARSALTLRLLTMTTSGASAAAATAALPEAIGGDRNFDYRYAWVRDASFSLDALAGLGLTEDVHSGISWLLHAVRRTAPDVHVFYTLDGEPAPPVETEIVTMPGYRRTRPVVSGNSAAGQRQLGSYGHLMDAVYRYVRHGGVLDLGTGGLLSQLAGKACDLWREPDAGLWELGDYQHYTSSKVGCWVALDRAVWLAEHDQLTSCQVSRWRAVMADIQAWVDERCWSRRQRSYTMHAGTEDLDAAVLLMARTGFCRDPERLMSTIRAIQRELTATGPLLYRYGAMRGKEGAFVACTFWLVEALARAGEAEEARHVLDGMLGYCNDVGLLSEEIDPATGNLLGNFPQALSHLALIGAARAVASDSRC
jgi:GH15 family glucan-1,4-alpha-glucosidase